MHGGRGLDPAPDRVDVAGFEVAARRLLELRAQVHAGTGFLMPELDLGGGYGIAYTGSGLRGSALAMVYLGSAYRTGRGGIAPEPALVLGITRQESGFDPIQESVANAIGLSQLIMPTAKRFAEGTGIVVSRETLRDPDKNLLIGSRFMAFLMNKWNQQISLVVPSYNAGEGAVARWVSERGNWDRDEFMEEIPYDETRNYSKRVISSYFTYRYLLHDEIPVFPNQF